MQHRAFVTFVYCSAFVFGLAPGMGRAQAPAGRTAADLTADIEVRQRSADEVDAFLKNDADRMASLWSDDFVVTNPLNRFVTKAQVLGMVRSGVLVITSRNLPKEKPARYCAMPQAILFPAQHRTPRVFAGWNFSEKALSNGM